MRGMLRPGKLLAVLGICGLWTGIVRGQCAAGQYNNPAPNQTDFSKNLIKTCGSGSTICTITQSSAVLAVSLITDGVFTGAQFYTDQATNNYVRIDFVTARWVGGGKLWARRDCCPERISGFKIWIGDAGTYDGSVSGVNNINCFTDTSNNHTISPEYVQSFNCFGRGRYLFVHNPSNTWLQIAELEIYPPKCESCPTGTWHDTGSVSGCTQCAAGKYGASSGQSSESTACTGTCGSGLWSAPGSSSSSACIGCVELSGSALSKAGTTDTGTTDVPGYRVHSFTTTGATSVTFGRDVVADVLVVGGGGGGGTDLGGGGGAGAVLYYSGFKFLTGKTYSFTVGAGGAGGAATQNPGTNGADSKIVVDTTTDVFVSKGGGGGARIHATCSNSLNDGLAGASGGGGGSCATTIASGDASGGATINTNILSLINGYSVGYSGGTGFGSTTNTDQSSAGGGGAGVTGSNGAQNAPGVGGDGIYQIAWAGSNLNLQNVFGSAFTLIASLELDGKYYVGGGGGGGGYDTANTVTIKGGKGGGGSGKDANGAAGTTGMANTGSGGGGGAGANGLGGAGGSGLILLRYSTCQPCSAGQKLVGAGINGACQACSGGEYSWSGASSCASCPADSVSSKGLGSDKCVAGAGKYQTHKLEAGTLQSEVINLARSCSGGACSTYQISTHSSGTSSYGPQKGNDGLINTDGTSMVHTSNTVTETNTWWRVDLGQERKVIGGKIVNRLDGWQSSLDNFKIWIGNAATYNGAGNVNCYSHTGTAHLSAPYTVYFPCVGTGQNFYVHKVASGALVFNEVEVYPLLTPSIAAGQLFVLNNDFLSGSFWGISGSVSIVFPQYMHPTALIASPQILPAISDNNYPIITDSTGKVVKPYVWYKFDSAGCYDDASGNGLTLTHSTSSSGTKATCVESVVKRGTSSSNFVSGSKTNLRWTTTQTDTMNLPGAQTTLGLAISLWFNMLSGSASSARLIDLSRWDSYEGTAVSWFFICRSSNSLQLTSSAGSTVLTSPQVVDNGWHHLVLSITTGGVQTLYVDNSKYVCASGCGGGSITANLPTKTNPQVYGYSIGRSDYNGGGDFFSGNVDDFRIYKTVLTDAQVTTLYQGRVGVYTASFGNCPDASTCTTGSKHCDRDGNKQCCVAGQYLQDGVDSACQSCPAGTYSVDGAGTSCTLCTAGTWAAAASSVCSSCTGTCGPPSVKRCISSSSSVCCNTNQFFVEGTSTVCQDCASGVYSDGSMTTCSSLCPPGQYTASGVCIGCPLGMYKTASGL